MEVFAPLEGRAWIQPGSRETYEDPEGTKKDATNSKKKGRGKADSNADVSILTRNEIVSRTSQNPTRLHRYLSSSQTPTQSNLPTSRRFDSGSPPEMRAFVSFMLSIWAR